MARANPNTYNYSKIFLRFDTIQEKKIERDLQKDI